MTDPAPRTRAATRWRTLVLVAAAVALLAGCELATGTVRTATELQDAGIRNPNLQYDEGVATLQYDADPNPFEARAEQDRAAEVIWKHLPFRIDQITVTPDGGGLQPERDYSREVLEAELGPRPANLDRSAEDIARRAALIAAVVAVVLLVLVVLVILLVVRAVRRRPAPQPAGAWSQNPQQPWGQQPGQPAWGQQQPAPPGQQSWGQPTPPGQQSWGQAGPPGQQPWEQPGYGQPPGQSWTPAPAPGPAGAGDDWPAGAPRPEAEGPARPSETPAPTEPPRRGPGDTQRLEPDPPPRQDPGPVPPS